MTDPSRWPCFGTVRACPKCGCPSLETDWRAANLDFDTPEHMLRICKRCGYKWKERPKDHGAGKFSYGG